MQFLPAAYLVVEVIAFILLGQWIGWLWALLLLLGLFVLGIAVATWQMRELTVRALQHNDQPGNCRPIWRSPWLARWASPFPVSSRASWACFS